MTFLEANHKKWYGERYTWELRQENGGFFLGWTFGGLFSSFVMLVSYFFFGIKLPFWLFVTMPVPPALFLDWKYNENKFQKYTMMFKGKVHWVNYIIFLTLALGSIALFVFVVATLRLEPENWLPTNNRIGESCWKSIGIDWSNL